MSSSTSTAENRVWVYAVLLALGTVIPLLQIMPWLVDHGLESSVCDSACCQQRSDPALLDC